MWFAENKSWSEYRRSLGAFSAIVCKDGSTVWAEDASGKTIASGESGVDDASVIQSAINKSAGKIIIKGEGPYELSTPLELAANIIIQGEGNTVVRCKSSSEGLFTINGKDNIEIRDLILDTNYIPYNPIIISEASNILLKNLKFIHSPTYNAGAYVRISDSKFIAIENCDFRQDYGWIYGVRFAGSSYFILSENFFLITADAINSIAIYGDSEYWIVDSNIINISAGYHSPIASSCSNYGVISNNVIEINRRFLNEAGIEVEYKKGHGTIPSHHVTVVGNVVRGGHMGIVVRIDGSYDPSKRPHDIVIANNIVSDCDIGINFDAGERVRIVGNDLHNNTTPLTKNEAQIADYEIRHNFGYLTERYDVAVFSGDGTTTQFPIAHGLVSTPTTVQVTPMTADAASDFYVTADDTNIYINYKSAPPSGTDNLKFSWYAEV